MVVQGYMACSKLEEDTCMPFWETVYEGSELVGRHSWVESAEALPAFCGGKVSFDRFFEFGIESLYYWRFAVWESD